MIYATIPSKYLKNLTEILKDLKMLYDFIGIMDDLKNQCAEKILECEIDNHAVELGQVINALSTHIQHITHNVITITKLICKEEKMTMEELGTIMYDLKYKKIPIKDYDQLTKRSNEILLNLASNLHKKYPEYTFTETHLDVDGTCTTY